MVKKAQSLSLNTMVVAAIVIVVLVVTIGIFTGVLGGKAAPFLEAQSECSSQPGSLGCKTETECDNQRGVKVSGLGCPSGQFCCVKRG